LLCVFTLGSKELPLLQSTNEASEGMNMFYRKVQGLSASRRQATRARIASAVLSCVLTVAEFGVSHAATVNWRPEPISLAFKEVPIATVIETVMRHNRLPVVVSDGVKGTISLTEKGDSKTIFEALVQQYNLDWSYDGSVVSVVPTKETITKLIDLGSLDYARVSTALQQLGILDPRNPLKSAAGSSVISVSGPGRYVNVIEEAVRQIAKGKGSRSGDLSVSGDSAGGDKPIVRIFSLRHATAADTTTDGTYGSKSNFTPGIATLLKSAVEPQGFRDRSGAEITTSQISSSGEELITNQRPSKMKSAPMQAAFDVGSGLRGDGARYAGLQTGEFIRDPSIPKITADARTNSVLVYDYETRMPMYEQLIKVLDVPVRQIEIEVAVVEVSAEYGDELSVKWRALVDTSRRAEAGNRSLFADVVAGAATLSLARGAYEKLLFDIRANESNGRAQMMSRPRVITRDNLEAVFSATETFQLKLLGKEVVDSKEISTGLVMKVRPRFVADLAGDQVEIQLGFQDGQLSQKSVDGVPVQTRTQLSTLATVPDQHTLVIGGHLFERSDRNNSRVPGLSSLPVVGGLFRSTSGSQQRRETLIFITPRIIRLVGGAEVNQAAKVLEGVFK
jgi:type III secretion protein C